MNQQQLQNARAALWHQNAGAAIATLDDASAWLREIGFCLFLPRHTQLPAPAPSFVEACMGQAAITPPAPAISTAMDLASRLVESGLAIPLNLLGIFSEQPDFLVTPEILPWVAGIRGDRQWKAAPAGRTAPIVTRAWEALNAAGARTVAEIQETLGRELTEAAVLRALIELWTTLRAFPAWAPGQATRWTLLKDRYPAQLATGANTAQTTALSAVLSVYLRSAVAATAEEAEIFLSPLTARSRIREVVHGMMATRQFATTTVDSQTLLFLEGSLPEAPEPEEEKPQPYPRRPPFAQPRLTPRPNARDDRKPRQQRDPGSAPPPRTQPHESTASPRKPRFRADQDRPAARFDGRPRVEKPRVERPGREAGFRTEKPGQGKPQRQPSFGSQRPWQPGGRKPPSRFASAGEDRRPRNSGDRPARNQDRPARADGQARGPSKPWQKRRDQEFRSGGAENRPPRPAGSGSKDRSGRFESRPPQPNRWRTGPSGRGKGPRPAAGPGRKKEGFGSEGRPESHFSRPDRSVSGPPGSREIRQARPERPRFDNRPPQSSESPSEFRPRTPRREAERSGESRPPRPGKKFGAKPRPSASAGSRPSRGPRPFEANRGSGSGPRNRSAGESRPPRPGNKFGAKPRSSASAGSPPSRGPRPFGANRGSGPGPRNRSGGFRKPGGFRKSGPSGPKNRGSNKPPRQEKPE